MSRKTEPTSGLPGQREQCLPSAREKMHNAAIRGPPQPPTRLGMSQDIGPKPSCKMVFSRRPIETSATGRPSSFGQFFNFYSRSLQDRGPLVCDLPSFLRRCRRADDVLACKFRKQSDGHFTGEVIITDSRLPESSVTWPDTNRLYTSLLRDAHHGLQQTGDIAISQPKITMPTLRLSENETGCLQLGKMARCSLPGNPSDSGQF